MQKIALWIVAATVLAGCQRETPVASTGGGGDAPPTTHVDPAPAPSPVVFHATMEGLPVEGMWKSDPLLADINADGHIDLAALPRLGSGPRVWLGDGAGGWTESSDGLLPGSKSCGGGLAVADLDEDGHLDLAVGDHCTGIHVYLGDGTGKWRQVTKGLFPALAEDDGETQQQIGAEDLDVGDVNGDGHVDLVAGSSDEGGIDVYLGDGSGRVWSLQTTSLPEKGWANRVQLADMNDDDRLDIVASFDSGPRVWLNDGAGDWTLASAGLPTPMMRGIYRGLAVADVNGDGRQDIATANWIDGPEVFLQEEHGTWFKSPDVFPMMTGGAVGLALGDTDGDGHLDMVVSGRLGRDIGYVRGTFLLRGDGEGRWTYIPNSGLPGTGLSGVDGVAVADIDGDGHADVAVGTGLSVESTPTRQAQGPQGLLVWRAEKAEPTAAVGP